MKKIAFTSILLILFAFCAKAQNDSIFCKRVYNNENSLYLEIDFYNKDVVIPGQEFMGEMAGYLGDELDFRKWLIIDAEIHNNKANLQMINLEGSEDLEAELTYNEKTETYTLKQLEGSTLKIARNRKWKKLPKELIFTNKK